MRGRCTEGRTGRWSEGSICEVGGLKEADER